MWLGWMDGRTDGDATLEVESSQHGVLSGSSQQGMTRFLFLCVRSYKTSRDVEVTSLVTVRFCVEDVSATMWNVETLMREVELCHWMSDMRE